MAIVIGCNLRPSMFGTTEPVVIIKRQIDDKEVRLLAKQGVESYCSNQSDLAMIKAVRSYLGIEVEVVMYDPRCESGISFLPGDYAIEVWSQDLPALEDRHEYTEKEIVNMRFYFSVYVVCKNVDPAEVERWDLRVEAEREDALFPCVISAI